MDTTLTSTTQGSPVDAIVARLRPRTVGEVIDQAFRLYRRHFLVMLAIVAVGSVPVTLLVALLDSFVFSTNTYSSLTAGSSATTSLQQLLLYVPGAALVIAMLVVLTGADASFKEAYRQLLRVLPRVLGLLVLHLLVWLVVYFPTVLAATTQGDSSSRETTSLAIGLGLVSSCLGLPYLIISIRLYLVVPALIAEDLGPVQAIRRSWGLTRNYWWRTFALSIVLGLLSTVISIAPQALAAVLLESVFQPDHFVSTVIYTGLNIVFATLFVPIELLAIALYYIDQRVRKEGLDLETAITRRYPPVGAYAYVPAGYAQPSNYASTDYEYPSSYETPRQPNRVQRVRIDRSPQ
ncbi:MAG: glycerophosphoryl diester phosphodiesterase membrane domain-containing protein [Chloroflexota bacterium]|nr:glycerophosphoryl diester phosphodiesterase membrane domain-containing protein [Chloroflexota bacterium]MDQ5867043.1 glycerophosphoryl diester phosphodiesterase membrane domain-containing protein [Chloroflexota bacterium]